MKNKWSYVAGIVDGEGSVCIYNKSTTRTYCGEIIIPNTSLELMTWLIDNFGGRYTIFQPQKLHGFNRKVLYRWRPAGKKNRENFLLGILPYLVIKKKQAQLLLDFERLPKLNRWQTDDGQKPEFVKQMHILNRGDKSVETNTQETSDEEVMRESELTSDSKSAPVVIQGFDIEYPCTGCGNKHKQFEGCFKSNLA